MTLMTLRDISRILIEQGPQAGRGHTMFLRLHFAIRTGHIATSVSVKLASLLAVGR